jgi:type IV pilus assembly protein PilA
MKILKNNKKGFTLLELIIVCSLIALLAGLAIPNYSRYRQKAEELKAISCGNQIYNAFMLYYKGDTSKLNSPDFNSKLLNIIDYDIKSITITSEEGVTASINYLYDNLSYVLIIYTKPGQSPYFIRDMLGRVIYKYRM